MAKALRTYQVTLCNQGQRVSYICTHRNGVAAVINAMDVYPGATSVSAKPINSYRA